MLQTSDKSVALAPDARLTRLKEGDQVRIDGVVVNPKSDEFLGSPVYRIEKLTLLDVAAAPSESTLRR